MKIEVLIEHIKEAFSNLIYPGDKSLVYNESHHLECIQVKDFFIGKHWDQITLKDLQNVYQGDESACLFFMTHEASLYYLPTYLLAVLENFNKADVTVDSLIGILTLDENTKERFSDWDKIVTNKQREAVKNFLKYLSYKYGHRFDDDELNIALSSYWEHKGPELIDLTQTH